LSLSMNWLYFDECSVFIFQRSFMNRHIPYRNRETPLFCLIFFIYLYLLAGLEERIKLASMRCFGISKEMWSESFDTDYIQ
jgi:hypothetical protein